MIFTCNRNNLTNAISIAQKAVDPRTTYNILEGILFVAEEGKLILTANNLEMGIKTECPAEVKETGKTVIDSKIIGEIVRKLPEDIVTITVNNASDITIVSGSAEFKIKGKDAEGFPDIPVVSDGEKIVISQQEMKEIIRQVIFSASTDETKKVLTGIYIETDGNNVVVVAIDGIRMALRRSVMSQANSNFSCIVPAKTMNDIGKILGDDEGDLAITVSNNQILFSVPGTEVVSRILEGKYLNYRNLAMTDYQTKLVVNTEQLLSCLERAVLLYSEARKYSIKFDINNDVLTISANSEGGKIKDEMPVNMEGKPMSISFNPRLFYEIVRVIDEDTVVLNICTALGPCTIKPVSGDRFVYTIAAVRGTN